MNPLLIQTLVDGMSTRSNRPVLQHWLDFVLMAVPPISTSLTSSRPHPLMIAFVAN